MDRWVRELVRQRSPEGFRYQYSNYQIEYSRNLVFEVGEHMDQVFHALIDRSRASLDLKTIKTILGYRYRPRYRRWYRGLAAGVKKRMLRSRSRNSVATPEQSRMFCRSYYARQEEVERAGEPDD